MEQAERPPPFDRDDMGRVTLMKNFYTSGYTSCYVLCQIPSMTQTRTRIKRQTDSGQESNLVHLATSGGNNFNDFHELKQYLVFSYLCAVSLCCCMILKKK